MSPAWLTRRNHAETRWTWPRRGPRHHRRRLRRRRQPRPRPTAAPTAAPTAEATAAPTAEPTATPAAALCDKKLKVGLVTDVGRVNDKGFNQSAYEGMEAAKARRPVVLRDRLHRDDQPVRLREEHRRVRGQRLRRRHRRRLPPRRRDGRRREGVPEREVHQHRRRAGHGPRRVLDDERREPVLRRGPGRLPRRRPGRLADEVEHDRRRRRPPRRPAGRAVRRGLHQRRQGDQVGHHRQVHLHQLVHRARAGQGGGPADDRRRRGRHLRGRRPHRQRRPPRGVRRRHAVRSASTPTSS